jgi:bifunctional non-homologous end joining protein LigD
LAEKFISSIHEDMSLIKYKSKRNLKVSQEPPAKVRKKKSSQLIFVVQKHHARSLHYDFRLEVEGVLKSWAIPKGPSRDPEVKRLAIMVEDHPYAYKDFEGEIPTGYGAGTVKIWDHGTYSVDGADAKETEKLIKEGLRKGSIHFSLKGKKLKGEFALVRMKTLKENQWLFFKKS